MRLLLILPVLLASLAARAEPAMLQERDVLRGRFVQERFMQGFERPVRSEGQFVVAPERGLIWKAESPFAVTTVVTPAGLVQSVEGTETTRLAAGRLPFLARLYDMLAGALSGDLSRLESVFTLQRQGADLILTPKASDEMTARQISRIGIRLGRFVETVEITRPGGDRDRLTFSDQALNLAPLDAAETGLLQ